MANTPVTMNVELDPQGFPVLLADVPGSGVSRKDPNAKSGNPRHDTRSGKFGSGTNPSPPKPPANVAPEDFARMMDAVRQAARQFDTVDEESIAKFLKGRAANPEAVDLAGFLRMVKSQQLDDVVDIVDKQLRKGVNFKGGKLVKLVAPRGFLKSVLNGLQEQEVAAVMHRLEALGHDAAAVDRFFGRKIEGETKDAAQSRKEKILTASDSWDWDSWDEPEVNTMDPVEMAEIFSKNLQPPVIHVSPQITVEAPKPTRKEIVRDEKGLMIAVNEVEDDS